MRPQVPQQVPRPAPFLRYTRNLLPEPQYASTGRRALIGIYPGSFDPPTNGHLDIITRAARLVDHLIVAVLNNGQKAQPLFNIPERRQMLTEIAAGLGNVEIDSFSGLLVHYAAHRSATVIVRGIRAISDYEAELQMALINRRLRPETETLFLMAREEYSFVSSRMVKEIVNLNGDVSNFVPEAVAARLRNRVDQSSAFIPPGTGL
jgi:pantetheine-phosphate adenylyltransferase